MAMNIDAAQLAVLIGIANGFILLVKPISRLHVRIDRNENNILHMQQDISQILSQLDTHEHN